MVSVRLLSVLFGMLISGTLLAQESASYIDQGLLRASATFSVGGMRRQTTNGYLHGFIEYYAENRISLRGDGYYMLFSGSKTTDTAVGINLSEPMLMNHNLFAGMSYHLGKSDSFDPFIGIQPGIAFSRYNDQILSADGQLVQSATSIAPVYSLIGGLNYYSGKFFHLFIEGRYIRGIHMGNGNSKYLDEVRISFGLGFDIQTKGR